MQAETCGRDFDVPKVSGFGAGQALGLFNRKLKRTAVVQLYPDSAGCVNGGCGQGPAR